jgi:hypothetical protein
MRRLPAGRQGVSAKHLFHLRSGPGWNLHPHCHSRAGGNPVYYTHMKKLFSLLLSSTLLLLLSSPVASAAGLVQCDESNPASCSLCALFATVKSVYDFASRITIVLAVGYVLWGGYEIMTSGAKPALYASGKKRILNAFFGIVIVLSAWFLVNAFIVGLTGSGKIYTAPWNELKCQ